MGPCLAPQLTSYTNVIPPVIPISPRTRYTFPPCWAMDAQLTWLPKDTRHLVAFAATCLLWETLFLSVPVPAAFSTVLISLSPDSISLILSSDWDIGASLLPYFSEATLTLKQVQSLELNWGFFFFICQIKALILTYYKPSPVWCWNKSRHQAGSRLLTWRRLLRTLRNL